LHVPAVIPAMTLAFAQLLGRTVLLSVRVPIDTLALCERLGWL